MMASDPAPTIRLLADEQHGVRLKSDLEFLGYGVQPPAPSWGRELNEAREELARYPHLAFFPGLFIFATVWSFNMFGDALRDRLDPRLRGST